MLCGRESLERGPARLCVYGGCFVAEGRLSSGLLSSVLLLSSLIWGFFTQPSKQVRYSFLKKFFVIRHVLCPRLAAESAESAGGRRTSHVVDFFLRVFLSTKDRVSGRTASPAR